MAEYFTEITITVTATVNAKNTADAEKKIAALAKDLSVYAKAIDGLSDPEIDIDLVERKT